MLDYASAVDFVEIIGLAGLALTMRFNTCSFLGQLDQELNNVSAFWPPACRVYMSRPLYLRNAEMFWALLTQPSLFLILLFLLHLHRLNHLKNIIKIALQCNDAILLNNLNQINCYVNSVSLMIIGFINTTWKGYTKQKQHRNKKFKTLK